jgi:hypothetical protein
MKWQPMEIAPRDGTYVLGYVQDNLPVGSPFVVMRFKDGWLRAGDNFRLFVEGGWSNTSDNVFSLLIGWRPLPPPPEDAA